MEENRPESEERRSQWRRELLQKQKKRALIRKFLLSMACAAGLALAVFGLCCALGVFRNRGSGEENTEAVLVAVSADTVRHFSFPQLVVDAETAGGTEGLTTDQFRQILQELYDAGYILVDLSSLTETVTDEDGTQHTEAATLEIPEGKIPFVLSQRDVSYPLERVGAGYASRLVFAEDGSITNEYQQPDGTIVTGSYDVVPILEDFLTEHPDFSLNGARGVLGLTGYNGIFGYRTTAYFGLTGAEGNPYAAYGVYDVNAETSSAQVLADALKSKGWTLACYSNALTSYGSELSYVQSDMEAWQTNVGGLIGGSEILLFPCQTDIGSWSTYTEENQKYAYLKGLGFRIFCIEDSENLTWLQVTEEYLRQGMHEIDTYAAFQQVLAMEE